MSGQDDSPGPESTTGPDASKSEVQGAARANDEEAPSADGDALKFGQTGNPESDDASEEASPSDLPAETPKEEATPEGEETEAAIDEEQGANEPADAPDVTAPLSDSKLETSDSEPETSDDKAKDQPGEELPEPTPRAIRFAGFGCLGLVVITGLVFFVAFRAALNAIADPTDGSLTEADRRMLEEEAERRAARAEHDDYPPRREVPDHALPVRRSIHWAESHAEAMALVAEDPRPLLIVFTASYATRSLDLYEGVFAQRNVETYIGEHFHAVHINLDPPPITAEELEESESPIDPSTEGTEAEVTTDTESGDEVPQDEAPQDETPENEAPRDGTPEGENDAPSDSEVDENATESTGPDDPLVNLCGVRFLPHVTYLDPRDGTKLLEDTLGLTTEEFALQYLRRARTHYDARP